MNKLFNNRLLSLQYILFISIIYIVSSRTLLAQQFTMEQTLSDEAQGTTIAFDGLAFLTGSLGADSFFPPGKVADFWGFQYLRDNDPSRMGHNTDFLTRASDNMFYVLTHDQRLQLIALASGQISMIEEYGYNRFVLMKAFRRLLEGDVPSGSIGLDSNAIKAYSSALYQLDGAMCYQRARVMGSIIHVLTSTQKAHLDSMVGKGMLTWPNVPEQPEMQGLSPRVKEAVMTYAGDMFSWYAGSDTADVYFCPERQGTYFGSFYMKDAPAVGHPGYSIDTNMTAVYGRKFLHVLTPAESLLVAGLVNIQRPYLYEIVDRRENVSIQLRKFMAGQTPDSLLVMSLMDRYGQLDGEIVYHIATNLATVNGMINSVQRDTLMAYRLHLLDTLSIPTGAYLYATPIAMPDILNTDFLFGFLPYSGALEGEVFFDQNQNGIQDTYELGLEEWKIYISGASSDSTVTDGNGLYSFDSLSSGTYHLRAEHRDGWAQTFPASSETTLSVAKMPMTVNFGLYNPLARLYQFQKGWNMISIHQRADSNAKSELFPTATSPAYRYDGAYYVSDTLATGTGYWLKFPIATKVTLIGTPMIRDTVEVNKGWNLIGSISEKVLTSSITSDLPGIVTSRFYGYEHGYVKKDTIFPGCGYWVKVNQAGRLILSSTPSESSAKIKIVESSESPPPAPSENSDIMALPKEYTLEQAYPNPFNPNTTIRYELPVDSKVRLQIYNILGQVVAVLKDGSEPAGVHFIKWDATLVASGIYFYHLEAVSTAVPSKMFTQVRKMVLIK